MIPLYFVVFHLVDAVTMGLCHHPALFMYWIEDHK